MRCGSFARHESLLNWVLGRAKSLLAVEICLAETTTGTGQEDQWPFQFQVRSANGPTSIVTASTPWHSAGYLGLLSSEWWELKKHFTRLVWRDSAASNCGKE